MDISIFFAIFMWKVHGKKISGYIHSFFHDMKEISNRKKILYFKYLESGIFFQCKLCFKDFFWEHKSFEIEDSKVFHFPFFFANWNH